VLHRELARLAVLLVDETERRLHNAREKHRKSTEEEKRAKSRRLALGILWLRQMRMETEIYKCSLVNAESIGKRGWEKGGREDYGEAEITYESVENVE